MKFLMAMAAAVQMAAGTPAQTGEGKIGEAPGGTPANRWVAHYADDECILIRAVDAPQGAIFTVRVMPGSGRPMVSVVNPKWRFTPTRDLRDVELVLEPGGPLEGEAGFVPVDISYPAGPIDRSRLFFAVKDRAVLDRIAAGKSATFREGRKEIARTDLQGAAKAVAAFRSCVSETLESWGIDPKVYESLRSVPILRQTRGTLFRETDLARAMHSRGEGKVVVRLAVDASGKPTDCKVLLGSENPTFEEATCSIYMKRASFEPALDSNGSAVASFWVGKISWAIH